MTEPYREQPEICPACGATLRDYRGRLACDRCEGIMMSQDDLKAGIAQLVGIEPSLEIVREAPGKRACPQCREAMTTCHIRVMLDEELAKPRPTLDRCSAHGLWFDGKELSAVFEKCMAKAKTRGFSGKSRVQRGPGGYASELEGRGTPVWWNIGIG